MQQVESDSKVESDERKWASGLPIVGAALLGLSIGLQWALTGIILYGPMRQKIPEGILTVRGATLMRPERDLPLYIAGCALCLILMLGNAALWRHSVQRQPTQERTRFAWFSAGYQAFFAVASVLLYILILCARMPVISRMRVLGSGVNILALLLPSVAAIGCCWHDLRARVRSHPRCRAWVVPIIDILLGSLIVGILFIPWSFWNELAGTFYRNDLLHHWNYFGMGPALCFAHGGAFSTDFYSQYGMGWPLIFSLMNRWGVLTYGRMIGVGVIYGSVYYVGFYILLRLFLRSAAWAGAGVLLAITLQMFSGQYDGGILWQYPSSTMLRHPMDVWFFLALLLHQRSGRRRWTLVAGLVCGLAIFFVTETGLYLAVVFAGYHLLTWRNGKFLVRGTAFGAGVVLTLLPLTWIASRGTLFHGAFWHGWMEGVKLQGFSGLGLLPIADVPDTALLFFMVFLAAYLLTIGNTAIRSSHESACAEDIFLACYSLYGLALLLIFVGRSHPFNLYHPAPPLAVVLTAWLARGSRRWEMAWRPTSAGAAMLVILGAWLLSSADFASYPSLASTMFGRRPDGAPCLIAAAPDLAIAQTPIIDPPSFMAVVQEMRRLDRRGGEVAAVDYEDTLLYYASGIRPWFRWGSLFYSINTQDELKERAAELARRKPQFVVMRSPGPGFEDVRQALHLVVEQHARLVKTIGHFEIWAWGTDD